jgi:hypothetical protein
MILVANKADLEHSRVVSHLSVDITADLEHSIVASHLWILPFCLHVMSSDYQSAPRLLTGSII